VFLIFEFICYEKAIPDFPEAREEREPIARIITQKFQNRLG